MNPGLLTPPAGQPPALPAPTVNPAPAGANPQPQPRNQPRPQQQPVLNQADVVAIAEELDRLQQQRRPQQPQAAAIPHPSAMTTPPPAGGTPPVPPAAPRRFDAAGIFRNVACLCGVVLAIALTVFAVGSMSGCQQNVGGNSFLPLSAGENVQQQVPVQMPSNFAEVSKGTAPHVEKVFSATRASWPPEAKAQYAQGFNPVAGRIPGTNKAWFYHDPGSEIWNPHPDYPAPLLPAAREAHVGGSR